MSQCMSCHAPIIWKKTVFGRTMPIDPEPVPGGNLLIHDEYVDVVMPHPEKLLHIAHFVTCPSAASHRRMS